MSLLKDKRIQKLLAQQADEEDTSSGGEDAPITFSSKFAAFKKPAKATAEEKKKGVRGEAKQSSSVPTTSSFSECDASREAEGILVSEKVTSGKSKEPSKKSSSSVNTANENNRGSCEEGKTSSKKNKETLGKSEKREKEEGKTAETKEKNNKSEKTKAKKKKDTADEEVASERKNSGSSGKNRKKARQQEDDDNDLLNAILGSDASDDNKEDNDAGGIGSNNAANSVDTEYGFSVVLEPPLSDERAVLTMVASADVKGLDCRDERIKNFGKESVPDVSGDELRRNGINVPKIKKGPFATPNLNSGHWYTLGTSGGTVELKKDGAGELYKKSFGNPKKETLKKTRGFYSVDVHSRGYQKAQNAFDFTINTAMGDVNALFNCWQEHPYHLPMLLQLSQAFHVTGDTSNSNLYMDMALHVVGMLLGSSSFGLGKSLADRTLPYRVPANKPVFMALARGMHNALRQGGVHTAFEISRVLLGLDEHDPEGAALMLDVTAVRSREWLFLIELQHRLMFHALNDAADLLPSNNTESASSHKETPETEASSAAANAEADDPSAFSSASGRCSADPFPTYHELVGLPGIHFNAALARLMYSSAETAATPSSPKDKGQQQKVKGNRGSGTAAQRALVIADHSSEALPLGQIGADLFAPTNALRALANAIGMFPQAALDLAEAIEEKTGQDPWLGLVFMNEDAKAFVADNCGAAAPFVESAVAKTSKLFALGSKPMWKSTQHAKFLRDAATLAIEENLVQRFYNTKYSSEEKDVQHSVEVGSSRPSPLLRASIDVAASALGAHVRRKIGTVLHDRYAGLGDESVTGVYATQIPRELLEAAMEEDMAFERQQRVRYERVSQEEARLMQRYEAAFGPLDQHLSFAERMEVYGARLEEHVRALGQDEGAVRMFLRTLLPWNDVQEMALRRAFEEAGVEDPVVVARRMQRQYERDVMDRADALEPDEDLPEDEW